MNRIPKIIHQIWSGVEEPLPESLKILGNTWKNNHPTWEYMYWDEECMNCFMQKNYPQYLTEYKNLNHNIQRWDVIRYCILETIGGVYVDFDYECIAPFDNLLQDKSCCFSSEPNEHALFFSQPMYFNNALMASIPYHPFMKVIIKAIFSNVNKGRKYLNKMFEVLETTGPLLLSSLYEQYDDKDSIYIMPAELVSPLTKNDVILYSTIDVTKEMENYLEKKLEKAIAVHYFWGSWL